MSDRGQQHTTYGTRTLATRIAAATGARKPHAAGKQRARTDHRGQIERVRAAQDPNAHVVSALRERDESGRYLGPISSQRGEQAD